jgi:hypothetical protein
VATLNPLSLQNHPGGGGSWGFPNSDAHKGLQVTCLPPDLVHTTVS